MNENIKEQIVKKIESYDRIIITRHFRPDGDAVGSTKGLQSILKAAYPQKDIRLINDDYSDYMAFLGPEDEQVPDEFYATSLVIVLDCGTIDRISNQKATKAKEIVKIDHHIDDKPYGDISWVEEDCSSASEMVADFCLSFPEKFHLTKESATYIYTGIVTDTGRFHYSSTSGETFRIAGILLQQGIDLETLYAHLYLETFDVLKFQADMYRKMKITENGVAYLHVTQKIQEQYHMTREQASNTVNLLDSIKDSLIWLAFIDNDDHSIRVRLRSRFVTVQELATRYHGGGHACASGATVYSRKEMNALLNEADQILKEYKETHEGWL